MNSTKNDKKFTNDHFQLTNSEELRVGLRERDSQLEENQRKSDLRYSLKLVLCLQQTAVI